MLEITSNFEFQIWPRMLKGESYFWTTERIDCNFSHITFQLLIIKMKLNKREITFPKRGEKEKEKEKHA